VGAVVYRWIVGAVVFRWIVGAVVFRWIVGAVVYRWAVRQTACDGELQQLFITQVTVDRIIFKVVHHAGAVRRNIIKQTPALTAYMSVGVKQH